MFSVTKEMCIRDRLSTIILAWGECPDPDILSLSASSFFDGSRLDESCEILPEDTAVILFTSGTTQYPKGVIYTHCNVVYGGIIHMQQIGMCPGEDVYKRQLLKRSLPVVVP